MNRTDRLYAIVEELRRAAPGGRSSTWLAQRFEVSARTIKRDMVALQDAGTPLDADEGRGGGYRLSRVGVLPPLAFTAGEATAVAIAVAAEPALPFLPEARSALARILGAMTAEQRRRARDLARRVWMRDRSSQRGPAASVVDEALRTRVVVHLDYVNATGERTSKRPVEPMAMARTARAWHLLGWCRLRQAGRWFRMDRIERAQLTREPCPDRELAEVFGPAPDDAAPVEL